MLRFKDRALERYYQNGNTRNLAAQQYRERIDFALYHLESIRGPDDLRVPVMNCHKLTGDRSGQYALNISKNWRMVFSYDPQQNLVFDIELVDYH